MTYTRQKNTERRDTRKCLASLCLTGVYNCLFQKKQRGKRPPDGGKVKKEDSHFTSFTV